MQSKLLQRFFYWSPRILCVVFTLFIGMFALDVFNEGYGFREAIFAFLIHLIPAYIILVILIVAWRVEVVGGIVFIIIALAYFISNKGQGALIYGLLFLLGILFLLNWRCKSKIKAKQRKRF